ARDKGVHIIMAHQSVKDLYDCPADLEGDAVAGSVIENCKFMLVYRLRDPDTADWVARMTGSILVDDEMRKVKTDISLTEKMETDRMIRQAERYYIDSNMLLNLPKFVGFVFTQNDLAKATKLFHIPAKKQYINLLSFEHKNPLYTGKDHQVHKPSINL
ncbi:TraM recognition domain-containing protein, partial [Citrobacter braakii]|uniref:TraM recognition domain-containing protein n=2 Tax=Enterobacterales TaxID=91347 RepID=UPI002DBE4865